jgi:hypothetical protein
VTLEAYLRNRRVHIEWNKLNCCNHVEMKLKWVHSWHWNDFNYIRFDAQMAIWLTDNSCSCFEFSIEMEHAKFKLSSAIDVSNSIVYFNEDYLGKLH